MTSKTDVVIEEKIKVDAVYPKMYHVIFLNDDVTPMELVTDILVAIFKHNPESAKEVTLEIHNKSRGIAGTYSYEVAEQLSIEATRIARNNGSPLRIQIDEAD